MILFCDTSALMKLYVEEFHSDWTRAQVQAAHRCLVSEITWAEMLAALALKARTQQIDTATLAAGLTRLRAEWNGFTGLAVDSHLIGRAGELAMTFGLRAYDSVQLASAHRASEIVGPGLMFCCFDKQLNTAAGALGLTPLKPE